MDAAQLQKEKGYKKQKNIVSKLIKKSKMQHRHEALQNARINPIKKRGRQLPTEATSSWKIKAK